ncbi:cytochrome C oxidase subunit IV family protein [Bradyrhizobium sp. Ai1a-2]|uniref:cytochrome C oxidase subunit IV family protein n=1 Tax=Bradyrhizobium sp. Ai1a-2 TaxID=196490 RepID=UPI00041774AA|nr:cytochrome C oxidase subunit IV family protein [Bradyrhizobium sp. Ai1a-2]
MVRHSFETTLILLIGLAIATLIASRSVPVAWLSNVIVLGLAALKGRWILLDFLGLRAVPAIWRGLVTAWVLGVALFAWAASVARLLI